MNITGGVGQDLLIGTAQVDDIRGGAGDDRITVTASGTGIDRYFGDAGDDLLLIPANYDAFSNAFEFFGGDGVDTIDATAFGGGLVLENFSDGSIAPAERVLFGAGGDVYDGRVDSPFALNLSGGDGDDRLSGASARDFLFGGNGRDDLFGRGGDDQLGGDFGDDRIDGGAGADVIQGGPGADELTGGAGADVFRYQVGSESTGAAPDLIVDFVSGVDRLDLLGLGVITPFITREGGANIVRAQTSGGEFLVRVLSNITLADILVTEGPRTLTGMAGEDRLIGGTGADVFVGGGGRDTMTGGAGSDVYRYLAVADSSGAQADYITDFTPGQDRIDVTAVVPTAVSIVRQGAASFVFVNTHGGAMTITADGPVNGTDVLAGGIGVYLIGTTGSDALVGGAAADAIEGGEGSDLITGGAGADALFGGAGADIFRYGVVGESSSAAPDAIFDFQTGFDRVDLSALALTSISLVRNGGATFLFGATPTGAFQLAAAGGDLNATDLRLATSLGVYMVGSGSADTMIGGFGADALQGGGGDDVLIGGPSADALFGGAGADVFRYLGLSDSGLASADTIFDFQAGVDRLDLSALRTGTADRYGVAYTGSAAFVFVDLGGDGANELLIQLDVSGQFSAADILF